MLIKSALFTLKGENLVNLYMDQSLISLSEKTRNKQKKKSGSLIKTTPESPIVLKKNL